MGTIKVPLINFKDSVRLIKDNSKLVNNPFHYGRFIGKHNKSTCIFLLIKENLNTQDKKELLSNIKHVVSANNGQQTHLSGNVYTEVQYLKLLISGTRNAILLFTLLMVIVLFLIYRSFFGVIIPVLTVASCLVMLYAIQSFCNKPLEILDTMNPPLILIVGMSDLIHLYSRYIDELKTGYTKIHALNMAIKAVRWPTFLTSLTTAIGFLTFLRSPIQPVKEFGLFSAIGIMITYFFTIIITSAYISILPTPSITYKDKDVWIKVTNWLYAITNHHFKIDSRDYFFHSAFKLNWIISS